MITDFQTDAFTLPLQVLAELESRILSGSLLTPEGRRITDLWDFLRTAEKQRRPPMVKNDLILLALVERGYKAYQELAEQTGWTKGACRYRAERLVDLGYLRRVPGASRSLHLTEAGASAAAGVALIREGGIVTGVGRVERLNGGGQ